MNTEIKNAVSAAADDAQYDERAKRLLGNKIILAHILVKTVDEFRGMDPKEVVSYIEKEPLIGTVPVEPGLTNVEKGEPGQRVVGFNTENAEINEGLVRFDIVFYVRMRDGLSQVIVNVEAQKGTPASYRIMNRAVFYVGRLISSQKERDFVKTDYDSIRRVFSIWICMNMEEDCMDHVHLVDDKLLGSHQWEGGLDLFNIVLIGIADELPAHDSKYGLHRLLGTLLSAEMSAAKKLSIMETEYGIPTGSRIREDVGAMCNLSQGIREKGLEEGLERGREEGLERGREEGLEKVALNMHNKGYALELIADAVEKSIAEVEAMIKKGEAALA